MKRPAYLPVGTHVRFTERASSDARRNRLRDLSPADRYRVQQVVPEPAQGQRVVATWPEEGEGVVVGVTRRQSGRILGNSGEDWDGHLLTDDTVAVYEVKNRLWGRPMLVPIEAVQPVMLTFTHRPDTAGA